MAIDLNLDELGTFAQMVKERAETELSSVVSRLQSAAIGEFGTLFSEGLSIANKWEGLHAKMQAAASAPTSEPAPAEAAPAPEPAPAEAPAPDPSELPTEAMPAVSAEAAQ